MCTSRPRSPRSASPCKETVDLHILVYEEIVYIGHYKASEERKTLAFFQRLESLDAIVQKHVDLATKAAAT